MKTAIIGKSTRKVTNLNAWLKENGCPEYADLYRQAGEKYGVRWDLAIFQSAHETNYWKFGGDVKAEQNNFAGIGAKGGGAPGDSFGNPGKGIEAQLQNLALRAGVAIPEGSVISPYVRANYDLISKRNTQTWEELTGTYATDAKYTEKIFAIAAKYDARYGESDMQKKPTWFGIGKDATGHFAQALLGGEGAVMTITGNSPKELAEFLLKYADDARTWQPLSTRAAPIKDLPEPVDPKWEKTEWIPFAIKVDKMPRRTVKWPKYFIIHWTAGRPTEKGEDGITYGSSKGYTYLFLQNDGKVFQGAPTNAGGYHVGDANLSSFDCLGIEVACAGRLEKIDENKFKPWYASSEQDYIPKSQVIYDEDGPSDDESYKGYYQKYSAEQKKSLIKLSLYVIQVLGIPLENIRGHDYVATPAGRKVDPGFSIGDGGMVKFRADIKALIDKGVTWDKV